MPIPSGQLNTWANQGAITTSSNAYNSIRTALLKSTSPLANRDVDIFLQGSYGNATNIYGDSDVDVVVLYGGTFGKDMSSLTPAQQQLHESIFLPAAYPWVNLRNDTLAALQSHYGAQAVTPGRKSIKVRTPYGTKPSDVIPAVRFRRYATFTDRNNYTGHWGIQFFDSSNDRIVNYPQYHKERGENKNQQSRTNCQYKATIRLFKNFRNHLVDNHLLADGVAPSYFVEGALYNVPDAYFIGGFATTVPVILDYLLNTPYAGFLCQNGVVPLIGLGSTQWPATDFANFVVAAKNAWDNWD